MLNLILYKSTLCVTRYVVMALTGPVRWQICWSFRSQVLKAPISYLYKKVLPTLCLDSGRAGRISFHVEMGGKKFSPGSLKTRTH